MRWKMAKHVESATNAIAVLLQHRRRKIATIERTKESSMLTNPIAELIACDQALGIVREAEAEEEKIADDEADEDE